MAFSALGALRPDRPASVIALASLLISAGILDFVLVITIAFSTQPVSLAYIILLVTDIVGIRSIILGIGFFFGLSRLLTISFISSLISFVILLLVLASGFVQAVFPGNPFAIAAEVVELALVVSFLIGTPLAGVQNFFAQMDALRRLSAPASFQDISSALFQALNAVSQGMQPLLLFRPRGITVLAIILIISGAVAIIGGVGPLLLEFITTIQSLSARAELGVASLAALILGVLQIVLGLLLLQMRSIAWAGTIAASAISLVYSPIGGILVLLLISQGESGLSDITAKALLGTNLGWAVFLAFPISLVAILYLTSRRPRFLFGRPTRNDINTIRILGPNLAALTFGLLPTGLTPNTTLPRFL